jgi:hypothetical protein
MTETEHIHAQAEISRLRAENQRLLAAESALRKELLNLGHRLSVLRGKCKTCEYFHHPETERA